MHRIWSLNKSRREDAHCSQPFLKFLWIVWTLTTAWFLLHQPIFSAPKEQFTWKLSLQNRLEKKHSQAVDTIRTQYPCNSWKAESKLLLCFRSCLQNLLFPFHSQPALRGRALYEGSHCVCRDSACGSCTFPEGDSASAEKHLNSQKDWPSKRRGV